MLECSNPPNHLNFLGFIMAGQRSYYGNVLTTTRGSVVVCAQIQMNGASAPTLNAGRGLSLSHTGGSNDCIITFPEKYGKCCAIVHDYVTPSGHSNTYSAVGTNYNATNGQATIVFRYTSGTGVNSTTADNDPTGVLYVAAEFEIGA